jgi:hypothetical protein
MLEDEQERKRKGVISWLFRKANKKVMPDMMSEDEAVTKIQCQVRRLAASNRWRKILDAQYDTIFDQETGQAIYVHKSTGHKALSKPYLRNFMLKEGEENVDTRTSYEKIFQRADINGDIRLNRKELEKFLSFLFSCRPSPTPSASAEECNAESARIAAAVFDFNEGFLGLGEHLNQNGLSLAGFIDLYKNVLNANADRDIYMLEKHEYFRNVRARHRWKKLGFGTIYWVTLRNLVLRRWKKPDPEAAAEYRQMQLFKGGTASIWSTHVADLVNYDLGMFTFFEVLKTAFLLEFTLLVLSMPLHLKIYDFVREGVASKSWSLNGEHVDLFNTMEWGIGILAYADEPDTFARDNIVLSFLMTSAAFGLFMCYAKISLRFKRQYIQDHTTLISQYALLITGLPGDSLSNVDSLQHHFDAFTFPSSAEEETTSTDKNVAEVVVTWGSGAEGISVLRTLHTKLAAEEAKERRLRARLKMIKSKLDGGYDAESGSSLSSPLPPSNTAQPPLRRIASTYCPNLLHCDRPL